MLLVFLEFISKKVYSVFFKKEKPPTRCFSVNSFGLVYSVCQASLLLLIRSTIPMAKVHFQLVLICGTGKFGSYWLAVELEVRGCTEHRVNMRTHLNCD